MRKGKSYGLSLLVTAVFLCVLSSQVAAQNRPVIAPFGGNINPTGPAGPQGPEGPPGIPPPWLKPGPKPGSAPDPGKNFPSNQADIDRAIEAACIRLGGKWRPGTPELVKESVEKMRARLKSRLASCGGPMLKQCIAQARTEAMIGAYFEVLLVWQCAFFTYQLDTSLSGDDRKLVKEEACKIQRDHLEPLQKEANAAGALMRTAPHETILESSGIDDWCDTPVLRFVREGDSGFEEIGDDLDYYGGPVFVELDYEKNQDRDSYFTTLEWDDAESGAIRRTEILVSRTPEDATLYRSDGIDIEPWTPIADGATWKPSHEPQSPMVRP